MLLSYSRWMMLRTCGHVFLGNGMRGFCVSVVLTVVALKQCFLITFQTKDNSFPTAGKERICDDNNHWKIFIFFQIFIMFIF